MEVESFMLEDDGQVPNNPRLPLLLYRDALRTQNGAVLTSDIVERFQANGWSGAWVNGIFPYYHYHAHSHEVLANAGEPVNVQFGGASGPVLTFEPGDVVIIPAGGGHCRTSGGSGLRIVGAYPAGQGDWDLKRADNPSDYAQAKAEIARVALPECDPVAGPNGPLLDYWS